MIMRSNWTMTVVGAVNARAIPLSKSSTFTPVSFGSFRELLLLLRIWLVAFWLDEAVRLLNEGPPRVRLPGESARGIHVIVCMLQVGGDLTAEQRSDLEARNIQQYTAVVGPTSEQDLRLAYRAADVLLFPSHYEGVGLPVLEAMASGLPVVTSGAAGLTEVAGDAAVVVSGREAEPYVSEVLRLAQDTAWHDDLVSRGQEQASKYRWVEAARKTTEVYRSLV